MSRLSTAGNPQKPRRMRTLVVVTSTLLVASAVSLIAAGADTPAPTRPPKPACTQTGCVRLHLGSDGRKFTYNGVTQNLSTASNSCKLNAPGAGSIMTYSATSTSPGGTPGMNLTNIGVRVNSSGNGTPCGQVDTNETLTLSPFTGTNAVIPNAKFTGLTMDLVMTGNVKVRLDLNTSPQPTTFFLETGTSIEPTETQEPGYATSVPYLVTSYANYLNNGTVYSDMTDACAAPNSSGPNSGANDNCEWTVLANKAFTSATLSVVNGVGTVSLSGSNDFANNPAFDTQFYLDSPPTANADSYSVNQAFPPAALSVPAQTGVLANDTDPDGPAPLTVNAGSVTQPGHGTVSVNSDGSFSYTPASGFVGTDSFTYQAQDGAGLLSNPATVTITVNGAPIANNDGPYFENQGGQALTTGASTGLLANDTEPEGESMTVNSYTQPGRGSVLVNPDGSFTYTSDSATQTSSYDTTFTYTAQDAAGAVSQPATVNLTVLPLVCTNQSVSAFSVSGQVNGTFTLLSPGACKGYRLAANDLTGGASDGVIFLPNGSGTLDFRGNVNLGPETPVDGHATGTLRYDPSGGTNYVPVPWCHDSVFDGNGDVTSATVPQINPGITDTWCIAKMSEVQSTDAGGNPVVTPIWQVFGHDDPHWLH